MKSLIVSQGKYGSTRQYADWLAEKLHLPQSSPDNVDAATLYNCDFVVVGSSVYVGKLVLYKWLKKHAELLQAKKIFLFIVCATAPSEVEKLEVIKQQNVPAVLLNNCVVYFLHGRLVKNKLSWKDGLMLRIGAVLQKDPEAKKKMLKDFDAVRKENLIPIVKDVSLYMQKDTNSLYAKHNRSLI